MNLSRVSVIFIVVMISAKMHVLAADNDTHGSAVKLKRSETGICSSKDIRNSVKNFNELNGCRVIEGFLMITLIDKYKEADYDGLEFPLLTEITEFFLVYRVNGLKSLGKLFPNLRIIRGNTLVHSYSFVIFEMMDLQEIGLTSLLNIQRGAVRIQKNPALCFVDTIDWSLITRDSKENVFGENRAAIECPNCPAYYDSQSPKLNADTTAVRSVPFERQRCWNHKQRQMICPSKCGNSTCNDIGECCDESCIGCANENPNVCLSCRHLVIGDDNSSRRCVQKCPPNTFAYENRRCVTEDECRAIKIPVFVEYNSNMLDYPYIPHDGKCATDCPSNFYPDGPSGKRKCIRCHGSCKKECPPGNIDSIATAERYRGCTHIKGPLAINIRNQGGHNIVRELEAFLSDIEVIEGPLQIIRSYSLLSLGFFKKLRVIEGDATGKEKFGLKVLENDNLQALFTQNVTIKHGRMFFHFNPKLCMNIIGDFKYNVVDLRDVSELPTDEVSPSSNGDKMACDLTILEAEVKTFSHNLVIMELKPLPYEDERQLIGYLVYYKPAPYQNVTMFDGRDGYGNDDWLVDDVPDNNRNSTPVTIVVTHLKPYTQYAYYIRTFTVAGERHGGITPIKYFRTKSYKPEPVSKLSVAANGSSDLIVEWSPPLQANGNLTKYIMKCKITPNDLQPLRDYCYFPLGFKEKRENRLEVEEYANDANLIEFEDELHSMVYVRQQRKRREVSIKTIAHPLHIRSSVFPSIPKKRNDLITSTDGTASIMDATNTHYTYLYKEVNASVTKVTLNGLKHFSDYVISVKACREGEGDSCGSELIVSHRTGKMETADDVTNVMVEKLSIPNHNAAVRLSWNEPENPNGLIVSYNIRYQRVDIEYQDICVTPRLYHDQGKSYTITDMVNGNFSFSIVANSLAGSNIRWSKPVYLHIDDAMLSATTITLIVLAVVLGLGALVWIYRRKLKPANERFKIIATTPID